MEHFEPKTLTAFQCNSVRALVNHVNDAHINREDIVDILTTDEGIFLLYYI